MGLLVAYLGLLVVIVAGILAGIAGQWFTSGRWWIWAAIVVLVVVTVLMSNMAAVPLAAIRWQLGAKNTRNETELEKKYGPAGQGTRAAGRAAGSVEPVADGRGRRRRPGRPALADVREAVLATFLRGVRSSPEDYSIVIVFGSKASGG